LKRPWHPRVISMHVAGDKPVHAVQEVQERLRRTRANGVQASVHASRQEVLHTDPMEASMVGVSSATSKQTPQMHDTMSGSREGSVFPFATAKNTAVAARGPKANCHTSNAQAASDIFRAGGGEDEEDELAGGALSRRGESVPPKEPSAEATRSTDAQKTAALSESGLSFMSGSEALSAGATPFRLHCPNPFQV
jgi:hypothetical protein